MLQPYFCKYFKITVIKNVKLACKTWIIIKNNNEYAIQIVCTKKIFKKSVTRNLIKRRFINAFLSNKNIQTSRIKANSAYTLYKIYPNKETLEITFNKISEELNNFIIN